MNVHPFKFMSILAIPLINAPFALLAVMFYSIKSIGLGVSTAVQGHAIAALGVLLVWGYAMYAVLETMLDLIDVILNTNFIFLIPISIGLCFYGYVSRVLPDSETAYRQHERESKMGVLSIPLAILGLCIAASFVYAIFAYNDFWFILVNGFAISCLLGIPLAVSIILLVDLICQFTWPKLIITLLPIITIGGFMYLYHYENTEREVNIVLRSHKNVISNSGSGSYRKDRRAKFAKETQFKEQMKADKVPFVVFEVAEVNPYQESAVSMSMFYIEKGKRDEVIYSQSIYKRMDGKRYEQIHTDVDVIYKHKEKTGKYGERQSIKATSGKYRFEFKSDFYEIAPIERMIPYGVTTLNVKLGDRKFIDPKFVHSEGLTRLQKALIKASPEDVFLAFNNVNLNVSESDIKITIDWLHDSRLYDNKPFVVDYSSMDYALFSYYAERYNSDDGHYLITFYINGYKVPKLSRKLSKGKLNIIDINPIKS